VNQPPLCDFIDMGPISSSHYFRQMKSHRIKVGFNSAVGCDCGKISLATFFLGKKVATQKSDTYVSLRVCSCRVGLVNHTAHSDVLFPALFDSAHAGDSEMWNFLPLSLDEQRKWHSITSFRAENMNHPFLSCDDYLCLRICRCYSNPILHNLRYRTDSDVIEILPEN
jgi:hypothetical protein